MKKHIASQAKRHADLTLHALEQAAEIEVLTKYYSYPGINESVLMWEAQMALELIKQAIEHVKSLKVEAERW